MTQPYSFPRTFTHTADTGHAKASAATRLRSNGHLGSDDSRALEDPEQGRYPVLVSVSRACLTF